MVTPLKIHHSYLIGLEVALGDAQWNCRLVAEVMDVAVALWNISRNWL